MLGLWRGLTARKLSLSVECVVYCIFWWMDVLVRWMVGWMCGLVICYWATCLTSGVASSPVSKQPNLLRHRSILGPAVFSCVCYVTKLFLQGSIISLSVC